ncbi:MAG: phosphate acyltransferase PlsX [Chloroflexi bacterium]|nr:phosphate acyltransferase PlsX [Chloroflexota bacterium]
MIIAVDAAGGDYAPHEIVKGVIKAAQKLDVQILLVGKKPMLHVLAGRHLSKLPINIVEASQVIEFNEHAVEAIQRKTDSSIVVGTKLVKDGVASAFVSAGHSGAVATAALLMLGKIEGVPRPAVATFLNFASMPTLLLDAGANADCRPEHLLWFAHLGSLYFSRMVGSTSPRIGLLSNGEEETKGSKLVKETHGLLKSSSLNFIGNIEGHDIPHGKADVVVTDGFTGNVVLKTLEGMTDTWLASLTQAGHVFAKAYRHPVGATQRDIGMTSWTKKLDYREYGGACLLGVNGNIIISHGRSQAKAIESAIKLAKQTAEADTARLIKEKTADFAKARAKETPELLAVPALGLRPGFDAAA